jgi:hypothetical protein
MEGAAREVIQDQVPLAAKKLGLAFRRPAPQGVSGMVGPPHRHRAAPVRPGGKLKVQIGAKQAQHALLGNDAVDKSASQVEQ